MPLVCCEGSWSCSAAALASAKTDWREDVNSVLDFCAEEWRITEGPPPIILLRLYVSKVSENNSLACVLRSGQDNLSHDGVKVFVSSQLVSLEHSVKVHA